MALETVRLSAIVGIGGGLLGQYRLLDRVGAGAFAAVYRARHEVMGIERAVKVLDPAAEGPEQRTRFLREARVAARLRHPNVVTVHDCGVASDGTPYIVMEYVAGRSLAARLELGVPPAAETVHVAGRVAAALDHAHELGVVHRDVKPANVLLGDDGTVKLGDFGIAQAALEPDGRDPWTGLGTPAYMAPEQHLGYRAGPQTDVYGLAAVLYELLTGRTPHWEDDWGEPVATPAPSAVNPYLPPAVDAVLASGLARDPAARPYTAGRLASALTGALAGAPGHVAPPVGSPR
jgi:eukaryotic-like serine/threonine-protein kinase